MEDLKQIQEFFSKPLNENKVTKEDFDKVVKILSKSKYPFTIMLVPKWDEIDIITGQDSPDEIVDDISQRLDSAGLNWGGNSGITISGDSSNYSRKEYSDIFRVNGGHKNYYEESLKEDKKLTYNDFVQMVRDDMMAGASPDEYVSDERVKRDAKWKYSEYLQGANVDDLFLYEAKEIDEADLNDPVLMKMRAAKMKADKLAKMRAANAGDDGNDKFFDAAKLRALKKKRAQTMRDMEQEAEMEGGPITDKYGDMLNKIDKAIAMLNEYNTIMPTQDEVDKFFERTYNETHYLNSKPVAGQKGTFNKMEIAPWDEYDLSNWNSLVRKAKAISEGASTEEKRMAMQAIKRFAKYRGVSEKEAKADLLRAIKELGSIEEAINEIVETIQAGKVLEEKLCKKGEAYRKRRMAAGEKSSAYLSGRAVKVCKGQMSGKKKKK